MEGIRYQVRGVFLMMLLLMTIQLPIFRNADNNGGDDDDDDDDSVNGKIADDDMTDDKFTADDDSYSC